jgi:hypothetical protein
MMSRRTRISLALSAAFGSALLFCSGSTQALSIVENFAGLSQIDTCALNRCYRPPDTMGAMGNNNYAEMINGAFGVYNRNGTLAAPIESDIQFWKNAGAPTAANASGDSRVLFDPQSQRWFVSAFTGEAVNNNIMVAVSQTADPTGPWKSVVFPGSTTGSFADYPTLGLDANGVYIGTHNFGSTFTTSLFSIPKADLLGSTPTTAHMTAFTNMDANVAGYSIQGVVNYSGAGPGNILSVSNTTWAFNRYQVNNPGSAGATLSGVTQVNLDPYNGTHGGRQPDGTAAVDTLDDRLSTNAYQVGNNIFSVHTIGDGAGNAQVAWTIINALTNTIVAKGVIADPNYDFYQASINANANGDFMIGFNRSGFGADGVIGSYVEAGHLYADGTVAMDNTPVLLKTGAVGNYHCGRNGNGLASPEFDDPPDADIPAKANGLPTTGTLPGPTGAAKPCRERWGDYSAMTVDPLDSHYFWDISEIPLGYVPVYNSDGTFLYNVARFGTQITEVAVPEPASILLLGAGLAGMVARRRKKKPSA